MRSPKYKYNMRFARRTRCRSTATLSFRATPQIQRALCKEDEVQVDCHSLLSSFAINTTCALQGGRGAGRLLPSPSELRHKYNMRFARRTRCRSTATLSFRAMPPIQNPTEWRADLPLRGLAAAQCSPKFLKILPSGEQTSHSGA